jgi:HEAT repeat protein
MIAAIAVMLVLFAVVVTFRREIRVRWWAHRLMATQDMHEHAYYLGLLATEPERAAAAAERLMRSDDAALRSFGVALAVRVPGSRGDALLERALHDADPAVRRGAIQGISVRPSSDVVELLRGLTDDPDIDTAMWATYSLGNTVDPAAADALRELAVNHPHAGVRAQAIMMLGQWRDEATIAALTACLDDDAVIECAVPSEQAALEALEQAAPQLASQAEMPHEAGLSNAERAAQVLEAMGP